MMKPFNSAMFVLFGLILVVGISQAIVGEEVQLPLQTEQSLGASNLT